MGSGNVCSFSLCHVTAMVAIFLVSLQVALMNEKSKKSYTEVVAEFDLVMQVKICKRKMKSELLQYCYIVLTIENIMC